MARFKAHRFHGPFTYLYVEGSEPEGGSYMEDCDHHGAEYPAVCQICHGAGRYRVECKPDYLGELVAESVPLKFSALLAEAPAMLEMLERIFSRDIPQPSGQGILWTIRRAKGLCWRCGDPPERHTPMCCEDPSYQVKRLENPTATGRPYDCAVCGFKLYTVLLHQHPSMVMTHNCPGMPRCLWCKKLGSNIGCRVGYAGHVFCSIACMYDWKEQGS